MTDYLVPGARWSRRDFLARMAAASGVAAGAAAFGAPSGLIGSARAADGATINVLTLGQGIFGDPFVKLSADFTKATGIKVNNVTMGYNESMQKQAAVFAAKGTDLDVVGVDYMFLKGYAKAGHLAPLDPLIPKADLDDYYSDTPANLKAVWTLDGQTYGLATVGNCQNFIYNAGHLSEAGLQPPDSWDDLLKAARKVVDPAKSRYRLRRRYRAPDQGGDGVATHVLGKWRRDLRRQDAPRSSPAIPASSRWNSCSSW